MQPKSDSSLAGKDLRGQDLRFADLSNKVLFQTDLRDAQLYGATVSLSCQTFDGVKLDAQQVAILLLMISQADIPPVIQRDIQDAARAAVGDEDFYVLQRLMRLI